MKQTELGVDIIEVDRFRRFTRKKVYVFLKNNFTEKELQYCFSFKDSSPHLAGTFAAKEAVYKSLGKNDILFSLIEIRREKTGKPKVWIKNKIQKNISVSISHTDSVAIAIACKQ